MTSTKTYYFTTVLRTILTERKVMGTGDKPAFDDIASFNDFWEVRENFLQSFFLSKCYYLGYGKPGFRWFIQSNMA